MSELLGVSIIVLNYNYGRFLAAAIDSALNQDHPLCEVIVVDDGSTDNSRAVIARYGDRIRSVLQETNNGQVSALNGAWPLARHPILIFLDADDLLFPHAAATVARRWTPATVKTQSPLVTIDESGRQRGHIAPKYPPNLDTATIRKQLLRTGGSCNSPASGNAYSRALLDRMSIDGAFELEKPREYHMDAILECNAPLYGEVVTIYEPLAYYRVHGRNLYATSQVDEAHFTMLLDTFAIKLDYLTQRCRVLGIPFDPSAARSYSLWPLECRLSADRLISAKDPQREPIYRTLFRALRACIHAELPISNRLIRAAWFVSVAVSPRAVARRLIAERFVITKRPAWFEPVLTAIVNITGWRTSSRGQVISR
jgi:glycosyltransferase involved in cell wall biosynthesis